MPKITLEIPRELNSRLMGYAAQQIRTHDKDGNEYVAPLHLTLEESIIRLLHHAMDQEEGILFEMEDNPEY